MHAHAADRLDDDEPVDESRSFAERATNATQKVMQLFVVRVFQRFSQRNGDILAAGSSYQAFFSIAAALYIAIAGVGLWLGASSSAIDALINLINSYIPDLISDEPSSLTSPAAVRELAANSAGAFSVTGSVALLALLWTALTWIGYVRKAVRDIFGLPPEQGNFFLLKLRDLLAALGFALMLLIGAVLSTIGTNTLSFVLDFLGLTDNAGLARLTTQVLSIAVAFAVDATTLLVLFRFLTRTDLRTSVILPGALVGGAGLAVLQLGAGFLLGKAPSNPLLASFVVIVGLLLWLRLMMMVIMLSAAWVSEAAESKNIAIMLPTPEERELIEATTLRDAAVLKYREARVQKAATPWYAKSMATRRVRWWAERVEALNQRIEAADEALEASNVRKVTVAGRR